MGNWLIAHAQNCLAALGKLSRSPIGSVLTIAVIGIALALPAGLHLLVRNGEAVAGGWDSVRDFSVYMKPATSLQAAQALRADLAARADIARVELVSADSALAEFSNSPDFADLIGSLDENPLPHTLVLRPDSDASANSLAELKRELAARNDVDLVRLDTDWIERLNALLDFVRRGIWLAAVLLLSAVVVIIGNTIRLDIQNQRAEIEVAKLLGATDAFVRRPFLYLGFWYGLGGSLLALLILTLTVLTLGGPAQRLSELYGGAFEPLGTDINTALAVLGGGLLAGLGGAWTAVARHIAAIQPKV
jgi:cell division transport system permease protein